MATTSNYGWTIPDDTDLVKNGALAIRTLGNAIDTTAAASFGGGLVLLSRTTGSTVSSISVDSIFTSTYDNYYVTCVMDTPSADTYFSMKLRASAADISTGYYAAWSDAQVGGSLILRSGSNDSRVWGCATDSANPEGYHWNTWIFSPNLAKRTTYSFSNSGYTGGSATLSSTGGGMEASSTARDGIKFYLESGTGNFTLTVFGVKK